MGRLVAYASDQVSVPQKHKPGNMVPVLKIIRLSQLADKLTYKLFGLGIIWFCLLKIYHTV